MKFLLCLLPLFLLNNSSVKDYAGTWVYTINTPEGEIKGEMKLMYEDGVYQGTISVYDQEYEMLNIEQNGNQLNFKSNASGYSSVIRGTFEDNTYTAIINVEGMQIPMKATRE